LLTLIFLALVLGHGFTLVHALTLDSTIIVCFIINVPLCFGFGFSLLALACILACIGCIIFVD
jgi:hypothetical protein